MLFLENGLRLNNARRQTDFGEITGLVDVDTIETVEVATPITNMRYTGNLGGSFIGWTFSPSGHSVFRPANDSPSYPAGAFCQM